ncbi:deaminase [Nanoarchaeota archaeon]
MIIGVTGMYCSGKDTVAEFLMEKGFEHISLSDFLREEEKRRGIAVTRDNHIRIGNELRSEYGHSVLGERALERMKKKEGDYVITSIRHPAEAKALMKAGAFFLVEVKAPIKTRLKRIKSRGKGESGPTTLKELQEKEKIGSQEGPEQQLTGVIKMAQVVVANDSSVKKLNVKLAKLLKDLQKKAKKMPMHVRPTWDEYFMNLAEQVGKRGTCDRGRAGTVVVRDKRLVCAGYVGSPVGLPHCDEVGHQLKKVIHEDEDGRISTHCVRTTHSEQNAICQAARHGIALEGATLYTHMAPCAVCAKMIINAGIKRVVCGKNYHGATETGMMFKKAGVRFELLSNEMETYANM